ncbi:MAG: HD-GYP domain-containing protein [Lachnospiraceae bacterium]|nr:HD-GYP domain-containing protein [Lachnospiraceae bacterium]
MKKIRRRHFLYIFLLAGYIVTVYFVPKISSSSAVISVPGGVIPVASLTGVASSIADMFALVLVVFFYRLGFYTSVILICSQFPVMLMHYVAWHNISAVPGLFRNLVTITAIIIIYRRQKKIKDLQASEVGRLRQQQVTSQRLFEQTSTALVNAVDAKDAYSHGHSLRVAEYSQMIAMNLGKTEEECREIYYAALLHDVGKIGIPNSIINKRGKLTEEEYEVIKQHPVKGNSILSSISEYPYLSIGAHYHHERYDGKGYPDKLKGEDIPEIARIISVADAYDAMTSNRSYRDAIPQQLVREEIIKGAGTQFDPEIAKIMQHLIDTDQKYRMREKCTVSELAGRNGLDIVEYRSDVSDGIQLVDKITRIELTSEPTGSGRGAEIILFDALDERYHDDEKTVRDLVYYEYCEIWLDGTASGSGVRKIETKITPLAADDNTAADEKIPENENVPAPENMPESDLSGSEKSYVIEAVKCRDHVLIKLSDDEKMTEITVALPDSSRFVFLGISGEQCRIDNVSIERGSESVPSDYIPRIAEEISYINVPAGDIPNVQIDGFRSAASEGIELSGEMKLSFHSMSLPTARLVWHCPFFVIYSSDDGKIGGDNYMEYALIRLDGEIDELGLTYDNRLITRKEDSFAGWDAWKEKNKQGIDVTASFMASRGVIAMSTQNLGITISNTTIISDSTKKIYVALSGDQVAITDIRVKRA